MLAEGELNLHALPDRRRNGLAVEPCADSPPAAAASQPASSPPTSDISGGPLPTSSEPPARRAVPTTFNPIINDEANILCHIARGDLTLAELAIKYETTVSNFCIWLQREDIQQKLSALTTCGAQLTRVAAVNQLPKAVQAMASQIDSYEFDRGHNLIKPGLAADKVAAQRDANVRKAANLLLRLARFDPSRPLYSPRPPRSHALSSTSPNGEVPRVSEAARARASAGGADERAVERSATEGALASSPPPLRSLPSTSDFPHPTSHFAAPTSDILSLCSAALSAIAESRFAYTANQVTPRRDTIAEPIPQPVENHSNERNGSHPPSRSFTSDLPHPTSHFPAPTSDIPHPTSDIPPGRAPPRATSWL